MNDPVIFLQALVDRIEEDLAEDINIASLSAACQISPWHFQRVFKSLVGDTLGGYIRGRRLTRAAQLILTSNHSFIDIAFRVGFNSHEAFTRSFKAYFGQAPKDFRRTKPAIALNRKPVLSRELIVHLAQEMTLEPSIEWRPALHIVGYPTQIPSPFATSESSCFLMQDAWMRLLARQNDLPSRIPGRYYGLSLSPSGNFTEPELTHIAGIGVQALADIPDDMVSHRFPAQRVAVFDIASVDAETVNRTIDCIYGYWLPNSGYRRGSGSDYELLENVDTFNPDIGSKYVIPLQSD